MTPALADKLARLVKVAQRVTDREASQNDFTALALLAGDPEVVAWVEGLSK